MAFTDAMRRALAVALGIDGDAIAALIEAEIVAAAAVVASEIALANGKVLIGNAGGVGAAVTLTGDVTTDNAGVTAIGAGKVTQAMDAPNTRDGTIVANNANDGVIGSIPVVHRVVIAAGANADKDIVLTHKTRVTDVVVLLTGAGVASAIFTVKNGATAITNGIAASGADTAITRAGTIDDAQHDIAAGGTLRVTGSAGASMPNAIVYVYGVRVA